MHNWDQYNEEEVSLTRELYNEAIQAVLAQFGGFLEVNLHDIPNHRTSKQHILKTKVPKINDMQMIPILPPNIKEQTGE